MATLLCPGTSSCQPSLPALAQGAGGLSPQQRPEGRGPQGGGTPAVQVASGVAGKCSSRGLRGGRGMGSWAPAGRPLPRLGAQPQAPAPPAQLLWVSGRPAHSLDLVFTEARRRRTHTDTCVHTDMAMGVHTCTQDMPAETRAHARRRTHRHSCGARTYVHTRRPQTPTRAHRRAETCAQTPTRAHRHTRRHGHEHTQTHLQTHTCTDTAAGVRAYTDTFTDTRAQTRRRAYRHTHRHTCAHKTCPQMHTHVHRDSCRCAHVYTKRTDAHMHTRVHT